MWTCSSRSSEPVGPRWARAFAWTGLVVLVAALAGAWPPPAASAEDPCLECHGLAGLGLPGRPLWVNPEAYGAGAHGELACADCHKGANEFPHPDPDKVRCDLPCHVAGASHETIARAEAEGAHSRIADPPCLGCHAGRSAGGPADVDGLCRSCHGSVGGARSAYPNTPGAFGWSGHRGNPGSGRFPGCADCHGVHGVGPGAAARESCKTPGCHPGTGQEFGRLFDHGKGDSQTRWGTGGEALLWVGAAMGALLLLHSLRGPP